MLLQMKLLLVLLLKQLLLRELGSVVVQGSVI
jgi:hypothetical protein